ncbi:MAG: phytanoyl-CoA dioxygenase family protein [Planctomycetaceae bacterium]|nr:phytanoyl-CoA dioxygenase family protein [Planctomycetales bacterium]MCB9938666.1 phytanoyl-CoA dioxygenase family protein [Planctomycetaceae bacterium]
MTGKSDFKIIPGGDELAQVERDLRFHPASSTNLEKLTPDEIASFNRNGYLKSLRVFEANEITDIRAYFDRLLSEALANGADSYSISSAHLKHGRVYDILSDSRIVAYVKDLLGDNVIGWGSHFFCKMPRDGKRVAWHQDASYWPLDRSKTVTVWLAIDDADVGNGCMRFLAGSHEFGHLTYRASSPEEHNVLDQTVENAEQYGTPVDDELAAGEISIHSDLLLHGSEANDSDSRRCGLTLRYCAADVRAGLDWNRKGVVLCGADPSGHWANPKRPTAD